MRSCLSALLLIVVLEPPAHAQHSPQTPVEDSQKGFDKQYKEIFTAFRRADERELKLAFDQFAIPSSWFTDTFGPGLGPNLADRYLQEFEKFVYATVNLFGSIDAAQFNSVGTHLWKYDHSAKPAPKSAPPSLRPLPSVQYFGIDYGRMGFTGQAEYGGPETVLDWGSNTLWKGSFMYIDGAFRFFGLDAYPFWDLLDDQPGGYCANPREQGGQVVHKVQPVYPAEAKQKHIHGIVRMHVTVAKDGSVKQVDILSGNPLLLNAAREAVMQWHYYPPFLKCSQFVETTSMEYVWFPPR
jgi:TonB family protein